MNRTVKFDVHVEIKDTTSLLKKGVNTDELINLTYHALTDKNAILYDYYDKLHKQICDVLTDDELDSNILNLFDAMDMKELKQFMTVINGEAGYNSYETSRPYISGVVYDVPIEFDVDMFIFVKTINAFVEAKINNNKDYVEQKRNENVAKNFHRINVILQNAIYFMQKQEMSLKEIADYLRCPVKMIGCILNDDHEWIRKMIQNGKDMYEGNEDKEKEDNE